MSSTGSPPPASWACKAAAAVRPIVYATVLFLHRQAGRLDLIPPEFGAESPVDDTDPRAVLSEWVRYLRLWAGYNPEEVFALKVGAALLLTALVALWAAVAMFG